MFTLDPAHPLYTGILDALSASPNITVADLLKILRRRKIDITLQHLYRTVNRMVEEQILVKTGTTLAINMMWLSYLEFFADRAKKTLMSRGVQQIFPLKPGERKTFKVDTLLDLQTLWSHLLVQLHRTAPQKHLLKYYSHAWWQLGKHALDPAFYKRIIESGVRCHWLFGNTTFLDRYAAEAHQDLMDSRLVDDPPFPKEGYNLNIYGPHVLECLLPERITKHFDFVFHNVGSIDQFDPDVYSDIFVLKEPMTLKLWNNEKQAAPLRAKIERIFLRPGR